MKSNGACRLFYREKPLDIYHSEEFDWTTEPQHTLAHPVQSK